MTTDSKIHARANRVRANQISSKELKRRKRRRLLSESLDLVTKIVLSTVIAVGALALIIGINAVFAYSFVFGVNDIADNGWNFWAVVWALIGFSFLTSGFSIFASALGRTRRR